MNTFSTLAQLVKERKSGQVVVPDVRNEVETIRPKLEILEKAGFSAIHAELDNQVRNLERSEKIALMTNRLVNDGYLIIDIPYYFKNGWQYKTGVFVKPILIETSQPQEINSFLGFNRRIKWRTGWVESDHSLMLCQHYEWRGEVPVSVAETLIEFKEKYGLENAHTDFQILAVLPNDQIREYVKQVDPLLLYAIDGHGGSRFAVLAWWGTDIETIEHELELDRESFRSVKILEAFK